MYDNTYLGVLELVYRQPGIHKRELSKKLHLSMPAIDNALKKMKTIIREMKSGNRIEYTINYNTSALTPALYAVEYSRFNRLPHPVRLSLLACLKELKEKPLLAILFGSYARESQTRHSDIDLLLVYTGQYDTKNIENTAKNVSMRTNTTLSPVYLDYTAFREQFHNTTKEFFRNLKKDKLIMAGIEWWRQLEDEET